jgi:hypothetical protein
VTARRSVFRLESTAGARRRSARDGETGEAYVENGLKEVGGDTLLVTPARSRDYRFFAAFFLAFFAFFAILPPRVKVTHFRPG